MNRRIHVTTKASRLKLMVGAAEPTGLGVPRHAPDEKLVHQKMTLLSALELDRLLLVIVLRILVSWRYRCLSFSSGACAADSGPDATRSHGSNCPPFLAQHQ